MNMHTALDHYHGGAPIVDKMLGNAYQTVRLVAHYIEEVRHVSHHMKQVYDVSKFLPAIQTVANTETQIKGLHQNLTALLAVQLAAVHAALPAVNDVHDNMASLLAILANMPALVDVHTNMNDILNGEKAASLVQVAEDLPSELPAGNLQAILIGLSNRIKTLEGATP